MWTTLEKIDEDSTIIINFSFCLSDSVTFSLLVAHFIPSCSVNSDFLFILTPVY